MTADTTTSAAILKKLYPDGKPPVELYGNNPTYDVISKMTDFEGANMNVAIVTEATNGASAQFTNAQTNIYASTYNAFTLTRVEDFAIARVTGQALKAAKSSKGAMVNLWQQEIDNTMYTAMRSLAISMFGTGSGARAQISASATVASTTLLLRNPYDVLNLQLNMTVGAISDDAISGTVRTGSARITSINRSLDAPSVTKAAGVNWSAAITGLTVNDYLIRDGDGPANSTTPRVMVGFRGYIDGGTTTLFGLDRSTDPVRLSGQTYDATGVPISEALTEAGTRCWVQGGRPTLIVVNPRQWSDLAKSLDTKAIYEKVSGGVDGTVSFDALVLRGLQGKIKVLPDINCPVNKGFVLTESSWKLASLGSAPQILDFDTNEFLRVSNADAYEVRIGSYANMMCNAPAWNLQITNLGA